MRTVQHLEGLTPCPHLPAAPEPRTAAWMRRFGESRDASFYVAALTCAQSLWLQGLPAQAILQLNRAFSADLRGSEPELQQWPLPYAALAWILCQDHGDRFIGNPRRHFQHLATRMNEPRRDLRIWRAWACWDLARLTRPQDPPDLEQLRAESIREPETEQIAIRLAGLGLPGEAGLWRAAAQEANALPPSDG